MATDDVDGDILRVPSPPQRRLSRSSIDLRDLEQQQMQPHDRVVHTDSAPSMIALENFYVKNGSKNKSESFFQPLISKTNFLNKPLECFHSRINSKKPNVIDTLTIESDNEDLARFIEDNYQYFKKQNGGADLTSASATPLTTQTGQINNVTERACRNLQLQACSDPDFLTLKNNIDCCDSCAAQATKIKSKKHKMAALSDSDFIVSFGNKSKKFTLKSKIPFKTILNGKFPKANKYNSLDHPTAATVLSVATTTTPLASATLIATNVTATNTITTATTTTSPTMATSSAAITANLQHDSAQAKKYTHTGLNNHLSQSLNGCYHNSRKNDQTPQSKSIQRVLSEGNETATAAAVAAATTHITEHPQSNYQRQSTQRFHQSYDAFDMFVKLFQSEKNNKNMCDRQSTTKFNYKIVVNSKEYDYRDSIYANYSPNAVANASTATNASQSAIAHNDSIEKAPPLSNIDSSMSRKADSSIEPMFRVGGTSTDQLVIVNHPYDDSVVFNVNADVGLHTGHVLVNNLVITSPPLTPKQMLSPKTINKEPSQSHSAPNYFSYSQHHLSPHMLNADTTSMSMELVANNAPHTLEQLVSLRTDTDRDTDSKVRSVSSTTLNNGNAASDQHFIKNDLALINSKTKCDKNLSCGINANMGSGRIRKPSVTYDINVINKSQDFNIDDICPQRSSYAARSGSTTSTSECEAHSIFLLLLFVSIFPPMKNIELNHLSSQFATCFILSLSFVLRCHIFFRMHFYKFKLSGLYLL